MINFIGFLLATQHETVQARWLYTTYDCNQNNQHSAEPSSSAIETHRRRNPSVLINVGGVRHQVMWSLLERRPLTRLGMLAKVSENIQQICHVRN